ncbi:hypothetical protein Sme01_57620 [Sphaerisporangium melleum]|uniref:Uncharacterized protein n=1 Tax=Sphaerisporangium melleum TaxID=321316 RepID=A0A917R8K2_9ACTN|nr:hypothetical protein GCM10007964_41500 [Sphaerisporangium melleum]GII73286.1 hypothetical protein Sme01_57620 [Sphaerisporangium melleum]
MPLHALGLWVRRLVPLTLWFSAGELGRFVLLVAGSELSHGSLREWRPAGTMFLFIVMVMLGMVVTVGMLHTLRGALSETAARRAAGEEPETLAGALGRAIIAYVAISLAWGGQVADRRRFADAGMERYAEQYDRFAAAGVENALGGGPPVPPVTPDVGIDLVPDLRIAVIFTGVAVVLRYVLSALHERRGGPRLAFGVAFFELAYTFYGAVLVVTLVGRRSAWLESRAVVTWWNARWAALEQAVPGWQAAMEWLGELRPHLGGAILTPLTWLTLAILVYGAYSESGRNVVRGTALEQAAARAERRAHRPARRGVRLIAVRAGLDRWPPVLHALRLTLRGGAPLFTLVCLCYVLLAVGMDYAERGVYHLIGTGHRQLDWEVYQIPVHFGRDLVFTTLTLCLFAAAFDIAATRQRANRSASRVE